MKHSITKRLLAGIAAMSITFSPLVAQACTSFVLKGNDGGYVYGRTMEFGLALNSALIVVPRAFALQGVGTDSKPGSGLNWKSKYGVVGANGLGLPVLIDGMNEVGMTGGLLNAPNTAVYQNTPDAESSNSIASIQMLMYALTNFATVDEAAEGFKKIQVNRSTIAAYGGKSAPVRMTLHDKNGKSLVIEYLEGKLVVTPNPVGVMTNDPAFRDQLNSIGNYANLSKVEKPSVVINGTSFAPPSSGSGLHGLPGDYLSPSRFIRALFLSSSAPTNVPTVKQVNSAWHMLGSFDIPPGAVSLPADNPYGGGSGGYETTEWSVVADAKNLVYYIKTYENLNIQAFDLKKADLNASAIKTISLNRLQSYEVLQ